MATADPRLGKCVGASVSGDAEAKLDKAALRRTPDISAVESGINVLQRASEYYQMPAWDYGGRAGLGALGKVEITYWAMDPAERTRMIRSWVDPDKTIILIDRPTILGIS